MNYNTNGCFLQTGEYKNKSILFFGPEEKTAYKNNKQKLGTDWYYYDNKRNPLTYNFNSNGYRCPLSHPDDYDEYFLAIGCSNTLGAGVHEQHRYSNIIESNTKIPTFNLGYSGGSALYVFHNISYFLSCNVKPPKCVFIQWPVPMRYTVITDYGLGRIALHKFNNKEKQRLARYWLEVEPSAMHEASKFSYYTTRSLLELANIPSIHIADNINFYKDALPWRGIDMARDLAHLGIKSHQRIADMILDQL